MLRSVTGQQVVAWAKVNLGDLFFAQTGGQRTNRAVASRIDRKRVDFLAANQQPCVPCWESNWTPERKAREELLKGVFAAAGLPLLRVPVRQGYPPAELVACIQPFFASSVPVAPSKALAAAQPKTATTEPLCPKCGATMALRTAKSGANAGGQFWGCATIHVVEPRCRSKLKISKQAGSS